jgi:hypothetical protein
MVDVTLAKVLCLFFYPVLFILRVAELLVTWTVQRFMPDATYARYCMYLCRLSNKVSFRSLLCVSFHQCSRGFGADKSGLLSARRRRCCLHWVFNMCLQMWPYFFRLINDYTVAVMIRTSCFQSLTVYEFCVVILCFVGSIWRCWRRCFQEVLLYYSEVCPS